MLALRNAQVAWRMAPATRAGMRLVRERPTLQRRSLATLERSKRHRMGWMKGSATAAVALGCAYVAYKEYWLGGARVRSTVLAQEGSDEAPEAHEVCNWSGTHACECSAYYSPTSAEEVDSIIADAEKNGRTVAAVGSALSPNGMSLTSGAMLDMRQCDRILAVDLERKQVTVEVGATVEQLTEALRPHGLTLQNFASIREQQIGGFTQVGAHGTGAAIPPVDATIVAMRLSTPSLGPLLLGDESSFLFKDIAAKEQRQEITSNGENMTEPLGLSHRARAPPLFGRELERVLHESGMSEWSVEDLFRWCRLSLGCLGVVTAVTLQCVDAHELVEETTPTSMEQLVKEHRENLRNNQHVKYLWYPYTDVALKVTCNPVRKERAELPSSPSVSVEEKEKALMSLVKETMPERFPDGSFSAVETATSVRDRLLHWDPLNSEWVARVNRAIAAFRVRDTSERKGPSDRLLGFDCGCQQWVLEVAFPTRSVGGDETPTELLFMKDLLALIEREKIAAHPPIEQRWTSSSNSGMSTAPMGENGEDEIYSWVGIIMYLPEEEDKRREVTSSFRDFSDVVLRELGRKYSLRVHWAKLERDYLTSSDLRTALVEERYDMGTFRKVKKLLDRRNVMSSPWTDALLSETRTDE